MPTASTSASPNGRRSWPSATASTTASGAALARAEIAEALPILASRLPCLELAGSPEFRPDISGFTGPTSLPIRFQALGG